MIRADCFLRELHHAGFGLISGTPCSYLTPLINAAIGAREMDYIGAANEGDAVAIACGSYLGGKPALVMFQNSGLGNAVNPLTSLTATFRLPVLIITTWRGRPDAAPDEPQHALMGQITPELLDTLRIPWELLPEEEAPMAAAVQRAKDHLAEHGTPYAFIQPEGVFAPHALAPRTGALRQREHMPPAPLTNAAPLDQDDVLRIVQAASSPDDAVLATTGYTGRALYALEDRPNQFYMVGSMGCIGALALGLARARPDRRVIALDGDGALLMRLGVLATIGHEAPPNLLHILLDNGVHDSTGGQATVSDTVDFAALAWACGYPRCERVAGLQELQDILASQTEHTTFVEVKTSPRRNRKLIRPTAGPVEVAERFRQWIAGPAGPLTPSSINARETCSVV